MSQATCSEEGCERRFYALGLCRLHWDRLRRRRVVMDPPPLLDRFRAKVVAVESGCWEWQGNRATNGYGRFFVDGQWVFAHRWAYEAIIGPIPLDKPCVCHHCDNPGCVRADPDPLVSHLFAGTDQDNSDDKYAKGRDASSQGTHAAATKTHCKNGHLLSSDNVVPNSKGWRCCRICRNGRERERRARQRREATRGEG